jgi:RHS repeat-associated protein
MAQKQGSTIRAYQQDPHGDLSVITDTTGTPTGTISYDPWGTVDGAVGTDAQQSLLGYQSQPTDPTTGLTDMGTRLYDPSMSRFTERDVIFGSPTSPLTLNQYAYANDSPLVYSDPTGMYADTSGCTTTKCYETIMAGSASGIVSSQGGDPSKCAVCQTGQAPPGLVFKPAPKPAPTVTIKIVANTTQWAGPYHASASAFGVLTMPRGMLGLTITQKDANLALDAALSEAISAELDQDGTLSLTAHSEPIEFHYHRFYGELQVHATEAPWSPLGPVLSFTGDGTIHYKGVPRVQGKFGLSGTISKAGAPLIPPLIAPVPDEAPERRPLPRIPNPFPGPQPDPESPLLPFSGLPMGVM